MIDDFVIENYEFFQKMGQDLFDNPELGFKEHYTSKVAKDFIKSIAPDLEILECSITGFKVSFGSGLNIGVVAELDAVYAPDHFNSNADSGAAHNCGHYSQVVLALAAFKYQYLNRDKLKNKLTFIFTPAEEFLDLDYRDQLINLGEIEAVSGKIDMILKGFVDDVDLFVSCHSMYSDDDFELGAGLAGFNFIDIDFIGKSAHAGVEPQKGINALDMAVDTYQYIREIENEFSLDKVRMNPILKCSPVLNVVPAFANLQTYIRVRKQSDATQVIKLIQEYLAKKEFNHDLKINYGYLEFEQDTYLTSIAEKCLTEYKVNYNDFIFAGGDIGDFSFLAPCIQIGFRGFYGNVHGKEFKENDSKFIYQDAVKVFSNVISKIDAEVNNEELYKRDLEEYKKYKFGG